MASTYTSTVSAQQNEVFTWQERPGAVSRLAPPWLRVRVMREPESLRDGTATLRIYRTLRWHAAHLPDAYDPPRAFADELTGGPPIRWRHTHRFEEAGDNETRVSDELSTNVPDRFLDRLFGYRHRQLADELAAMQRARQLSHERLVIGITGSSGFIGSALCALLTSSGHRVVRLVRRDATAADERRWDPFNPAGDLLDGLDAVVHLAGAPILGRFTSRHIVKVRDSRVTPTRLLAELAARRGVGTFVSASAVGYYGGDRGDEVLEESADPGDGVLADIVTSWEAATRPAIEAGIRTVQIRTGVVMSPDGGVLGMLSPLFNAGAGGPLGNGKQWMAWIALDDLLDIYRRALIDTTLNGPVNAVAPEPERNIEFTRTLGRVLRRPTYLRVPAFGPATVLGRDGADEFALASQRVAPHALMMQGHAFRYPQLEPALRHMFGRVPANQ